MSAASSFATSRASAFVTSTNDFLRLSTAEKLWRALNPLGWSYIRIVVPAASIIVLPREGHPMLPADIRKLSLPASRLLLPRLKPLFYLFKVIILPQAVTATTLYMVLRYLLKDSDQLDAQRDRLGRGENERTSIAAHRTSPGPKSKDSSRLFSGTSRPQVFMLPCSHETDIDMIATSPDGQLMVSVGVDDSVCLWRFTYGQMASGTREPLLAQPVILEGPIHAASVSSDKRWVAVCSATGLVRIWRILDDSPPTSQDLRVLSEDRSERIIAVSFDCPTINYDDPFIDIAQETQHTLTRPALFVALNDGEILSVDDELHVTTIIRSFGQASRVFFLPPKGQTEDGMWIVSASQSAVTVYGKTGTLWSGLGFSAEAPTEDNIFCASRARLDSGDPATEIIAFGRRSGLVEIFNASGTLLVMIGQSLLGEGIRRVDLAVPSFSRCAQCGCSSSEGFFVISSTAQQVYVDRILPSSAILCRCSSARRSVLGDDSTSKSSSPSSGSPSKAPFVVPPRPARTRFTPYNSPRRSPSLLPPVSNGDFPLSFHGARRFSNNMQRDGSTSPKRAHIIPLIETPGQPGIEREMKVYPLGAVISPSGSGNWMVMRDTLVGIRRVASGIDDSQWQLWAIDLTIPWNGHALVVETADLGSLIRRSNVRPMTDVGNSIRDRRTERLVSLKGRAPFPSASSSLSIPTHSPLSYVEVHPFTCCGPGSVVAGFGNRLGVISLPERVKSEPGLGSSGAGISTRRPVMSARAPPPRRNERIMDNAEANMSSKTK